MSSGLTMARLIEIEPLRSLTEHAEFPYLAGAVTELRAHARTLADRMRGRTIWMVNSTALGGGVAEMLPGMITHLRELGLRAEWLVLESNDEAFFQLTKRVHNMLHGHGAPGLGPTERALYERVNAANAEAMQAHLRDGDMLIVHDPQPLPLIGMLTRQRRLHTIWRCHIGLDDDNAATGDAWSFLEPYARACQRAVFSAPEYVPPFLDDRSVIIPPALDPLTPKNRRLHVQEVVAVLARAGLTDPEGLHSENAFPNRVRRLQPDGTWGDAWRPDDPGLLTRPLVTQVSRWDGLKGFAPLIEAFASLKANPASEDSARLRHARLVLAGPDPDSVADDPEALAVLAELRQQYLTLHETVRRDILLLALPMQDPIANAHIVNALQRVSTVIVQNSIREGFGLTITEAMWKGIPVLSNSRACGPRQQVSDDVEGRLVDDPTDTAVLARTIEQMVLDTAALERWGRAAERRAWNDFLVHAQLTRWIDLLVDVDRSAPA